MLEYIKKKKHGILSVELNKAGIVPVLLVVDKNLDTVSDTGNPPSFSVTNIGSRDWAVFQLLGCKALRDS